MLLAPGCDRVVDAFKSEPPPEVKTDDAPVTLEPPSATRTDDGVAARPELRKGGLTGKVLRDGSPLAGVSVELCPSPGMMFTESPCADAAIKFAGTADDKGVWTFDDVPLGAYGLAVEVGGKWQITLGERVGAGMKEGKLYDTGSMSLDRR